MRTADRQDITCERLQILTTKDLIITANARLAHALQQDIDRHYQSQNISSWPTLPCQPLTAWWHSLFHQTPQTQHCLSAFQELTLWKTVIREHQPHALMDWQATAEQAQQAWQLLQQWEVTLDDCTHFPLSVDTEWFLQWARAFEEHCHTHQWITNAALPNHLYTVHEHIHWPAHIAYIGFDQLPPQWTRWLEYAKTHTDIQPLTHLHQPHTIQRVETAQPTEEIRRALQWAHDQTQQHPNWHIACIIPDLHERAHEIRRTWHDIQQDSQYSTSCHISAGRPLTEQPLIQTALAWLQIAPTDNASFDTLGSLLCSPYTCPNQSTRDAAHKLDLQLRSNAQALSFKEWVTLLSQHTTADYAPLITAWEAYLALRESTPPSQSPADWSQTFITALHTIGWATHPKKTTIEHQLIQRFYSLLEEFATLNHTHPQCHWEQACQLLKELALNTRFQQQDKTDANIHILGLYEAHSSLFDAAWITGLTDAQFPPALAPHPFLPLDLQKQYAFPKTIPEREQAYAEQLIHTLTHCAPWVIVSSSAQQDEQTLAPSPLIRHYPLHTLHITTHTHPTPQLDTLEDNTAPPVQPTDRIRGGTALLKTQALCPFRAFAQYRLSADDYPEPDPLLSTQEQGQLLHYCLEQLWTQFQSQDTLLSLSPKELENHIRTAATKACHDQLNRDNTWKTLEQQRLTQQLIRWFDVEKKRAHFDIVALEQDVPLTIGPLTLHTRIDRIDRVGQHELIIDYKTTAPSLYDWFGDTLFEPQLPLYTLTPSATRTRGIAFAEINGQHTRIKGIWAEPQADPIAPGLIPLHKMTDNPVWSEQKKQWDTQLSNLAHAFFSGDAAVTPQHPQACTYCHLHGLCRITEQ